MEKIDIGKKASGYKAADWIQDGMLIGLGTGSTVFFFIEKLIERCQQGLKIKAVASSIQSERLALKNGIPIVDINQITHLDMTVDGADQIDLQKRMIKGGGGALVREKILASMSREMVVIVDETKVVSRLGKCKLPIEILPFAHLATIKHITDLKHEGSLRKNQDGALYVTDNGNYIFDIALKEIISDPENHHDQLLYIPGVIDTGFFFNLAGRVVIGQSDGKVKITPV